MSFIIIVKQQHVIYVILRSFLYPLSHGSKLSVNRIFKTCVILEKFLFSLLRPEFDGVLRYTKYL